MRRSIPFLDWERPLDRDTPFELLPGVLDGALRELRLERDPDTLAVVGHATGHIDPSGAARIFSATLGASVPSDTEVEPMPEVRARRGDRIEVRLEGVHDGGIDLQASRSLADQTLRVHLASVSFPKLGPAVRVAIWCVNGLRGRDLVLSEQLFREVTVSARRRWPDGLEESVQLERTESHHRAAFPLRPTIAGCGRTWYFASPDGAGPDDLRPVGIYADLEAEPPTWDQILDYVDALGVVLGRRHVAVGLTLYDAAGRPVRADYRTPAGDLRPEARLATVSPVVPADRVTEFPAEPLNALLEKVVDNAAALRLAESADRIWLSYVSPLELAFPAASAALESLANAWFRSTKTKSSGVYLAAAKWEALSAPAVALLRGALGQAPHADRIVRRVEGANRFGANERVERFFDEIGMAIGAVEREALRSRNGPTHGGRIEDPVAAYRLLQAYRTMYTRALLLSVGWTGEYVDYSTIGHPARPIAEPLGGPAGDGVPPKVRR